MGSKRLTDKEGLDISLIRKNGGSISEIAKLSGRSKSLISRLVRRIPVSEQHLNRWKAKRGGNQARAELRWLEAERKAIEILGSPLRDALLVSACLYWAEGNKKEFVFTNTDPRMIKVLIEHLKSLGFEMSRLKVNVRIYEDIDPSKAKQFWSVITEVPVDQIGTVNILHGKKKGKLEFGMCRLRIVKGMDYFKLLMSTVKLINQNIVPIAQRIELQTPKL